MFFALMPRASFYHNICDVFGLALCENRTRSFYLQATKMNQVFLVISKMCFTERPVLTLMGWV